MHPKNVDTDYVRKKSTVNYCHIHNLITKFYFIIFFFYIRISNCPNPPNRVITNLDTWIIEIQNLQNNEERYAPLLRSKLVPSNSGHGRECSEIRVLVITGLDGSGSFIGPMLLDFLGLCFNYGDCFLHQMKF